MTVSVVIYEAPSLSVTLTVIVYCPGTSALKPPLSIISTLLVKSPSSLSVALVTTFITSKL